MARHYLHPDNPCPQAKERLSWARLNYVPNPDNVTCKRCLSYMGRNTEPLPEGGADLMSEQHSWIKLGSDLAEAVLAFQDLNDYNHSDYCDVWTPEQWNEYYAEQNPGEYSHLMAINPGWGLEDHLVLVYRNPFITYPQGTQEGQPKRISDAFCYFARGWVRHMMLEAS